MTIAMTAINTMTTTILLTVEPIVSNRTSPPTTQQVIIAMRTFSNPASWPATKTLSIDTALNSLSSSRRMDLHMKNARMTIPQQQPQQLQAIIPTTTTTVLTPINNGHCIVSSEQPTNSIAYGPSPPTSERPTASYTYPTPSNPTPPGSTPKHSPPSNWPWSTLNNLRASFNSYNARIKWNIFTLIMRCITRGFVLRILGSRRGGRPMCIWDGVRVVVIWGILFMSCCMHWDFGMNTPVPIETTTSPSTGTTFANPPKITSKRPSW
mmetsp:Transcript_18748/g.34554  ORF Transcript_18748/g.34554 Transcript_18748/m.34554 type:complete len:266 (+) Transcript_18748:386-1183(+)